MTGVRVLCCTYCLVPHCEFQDLTDLMMTNVADCLLDSQQFTGQNCLYQPHAVSTNETLLLCSGECFSNIFAWFTYLQQIL